MNNNVLKGVIKNFAPERGISMTSRVGTMDPYTMAKLYYPRFWQLWQVQALVKVGALTEEEYKEITGLDYK